MPPRYVRKMFDLKQGPVMDAFVVPANRLLHRGLARITPLNFYLMNTIAPAAVPVVAPVLLGIAPTSPTVMTPREAQARYGYDVPAQAHQDLRARQHQRVFEQQVAASDEGLIESEEHIGAMGNAYGMPV